MENQFKIFVELMKTKSLTSNFNEIYKNSLDFYQENFMK